MSLEDINTICTFKNLEGLSLDIRNLLIQLLFSQQSQGLVPF